MYRRHEQFERVGDRLDRFENQTFGEPDVYGLLSLSVAGFVGEYARVVAKIFSTRRCTFPNKALQTTPMIQTFLLFYSRQYGVSDL